MTTPADETDRLVRRIPWAAAIAIAVGLVWYGVTQWAGIAFDRDAVLLVAFAFLAVLVHAGSDAPPIPPPRPAAGEAAPTVAPEDIVLPEEHDRPIVLPLIGCLILGMGGCLLLGAAAWLLLTQHQADALALGSALLGSFLIFLAVLGWFDVRRTLYIRRLERRRRNKNPER